MNTTKFSPKPWQLSKGGVLDYELKDSSGKTILFASKNIKRPDLESNFEHIVECVNACHGLSIEDVKLAKEHREACMRWERMMMTLLGEDSHAQVTFSIEMLKNERAEFLAEVIKLKTNNTRLKEGFSELAEKLLQIKNSAEEDDNPGSLAMASQIGELLARYIP